MSPLMNKWCIEYAYIQTVYEELMKFKTKKQFSWEKQAEVNDEVEPNMNSEDFSWQTEIANSVEDSFSNSFQWRIKRLRVLTVLERVES